MDEGIFVPYALRLSTGERGRAMSNVATVQSMYEAFGKGDVQAILDRVSDDVDWDKWDTEYSAQKAGLPWLERRSGKEGVAKFFEIVAGSFDFHDFAPQNILEGPNQVAATIKIDLTVKETGERIQDEEIHLWTFDDDGKVVAFRHFLDTAQHIKAAKGSLAEA
jgi:uncharacterized protein